MLTCVLGSMFHADKNVWLCDGIVCKTNYILHKAIYPRRARSALGVDTVLTLDVCLYVCMYVCMYVTALERKRLIGMT